MNKRLVFGFAVCMIIGLSSAFLYGSVGYPKNEQPAASVTAESATDFPQTNTDSLVESGAEGDASESKGLPAESIDPVTAGEVQAEQVTGNAVFVPEKPTEQIFLSGELSTPQVPGEVAAKTFLQEKKQAIGLADDTEIKVIPWGDDVWARAAALRRAA